MKQALKSLRMSKGGEIKQGERNAHLFLKGSGIDISNSEKKT